MITYTITTEQFDKTNKSLSNALDMEHHYIDYQTTTFEIKSVGRGGKTMGTTGYKFTEEQRKRLSLSKKGRPNGLKGRIFSEESKQKMRESALKREALKRQTVGK